MGPAGTLSVPRTYHTATLLNSGKVLIAGGGIGNSGTLTTSAELYDPGTNGWSGAGNMSLARRNHTATVLQTGEVLEAGWYFVAQAELYRPSTNDWALAGSLSTARGYHAAALLKDGRVLAVGGSTNGIDQLKSAELFSVPVLGTGADHTCVAMSGSVQCWGRNDGGQLGNGTLTNSPTPVTVLGLTADVRSLVGGIGHTCALLLDGHVKCWGANTFGEIGDGTYTPRHLPVDVCETGSGGACAPLGDVVEDHGWLRPYVRAPLSGGVMLGATGWVSSETAEGRIHQTLSV